MLQRMPRVLWKIGKIGYYLAISLPKHHCGLLKVPEMNLSSLFTPRTSDFVLTLLNLRALCWTKSSENQPLLRNQNIAIFNPSPASIRAMYIAYFASIFRVWSLAYENVVKISVGFHLLKKWAYKKWILFDNAKIFRSFSITNIFFTLLPKCKWVFLS